MEILWIAVVRSMTRDELKEAISCPAEMTDRPLDSAMVELLVKETEDEAAIPAHRIFSVDTPQLANI